MSSNTQIIPMRSDKMRSTNVGKLIWQMSLPAMLSMLVQSLYNIVDSIFVANIEVTNAIYNGTALGEDSFLAVSIALPMVFIVNAVGIAIAVGANAYIARKLGEGNTDRANQAAKTAIVMAVIAWAVVAVVGLVISEPFVKMFVNNENATDVGYVIDQATMYLRLYMLFCLGFYIEMSCNRILQATGNMRVPMICQMTGAVTNIVLDAVFILGFGWGVTGAIVATLIGQWAAGAVALSVLLFKKQDVSISMKGYRPRREYFGFITKVGLPAFFINSLGSVILILVNNILKDTNNGIFILSAYFKVQSFIFMPIFGLLQGSVPIMSYNYGANLKERFYRAYKIVIIITMSIATFGSLMFFSIPELLLSALTDKADIIAEGAFAFRRISLAFIPAGIGIITINVLQAINCPVTSLLVSLSRQLIFLLPSAYLLFYLGGQPLLWWAYPIAEVLAIVIFFPIALVRMRKQFLYKERQYQQGTILGADDSTTLDSAVAIEQ